MVAELLLVLSSIARLLLQDVKAELMSHQTGFKMKIKISALFVQKTMLMTHGIHATYQMSSYKR